MVEKYDTTRSIPLFAKGYSLSLASQSPRRRQLLEMLDLPFALAPKMEVDETWPEGMAPEEVPLWLSGLKAAAYRREMGERDVFITADTVVILDGEVLGKPANDSEAAHMLKTLSGRTHRVVTGVCIFTRERERRFSAATDVVFSSIPEGEIDSYVARYHPLDKAGAYGIQEWIGAVGIRSINGSFYNVMGLPVHRLWEELKAFNV